MLNILWVEDEFSEDKKNTWFKNRAVYVKTNFLEAKEAINSCLGQFDLIVLDINLENTEHSSEIIELANQFKISEKEFLEESGMNLFLNLLEQGFPKEQIIFLTANADINRSRTDELREAYRQGDDNAFDEVLGTIRNERSEETVKECSKLIDADDVEGLFQYLESYFNDLNDGVTKNTYNRFCEAYQRCRIESPKAINKGLNEAKQHLNNWLEKHEKNDYLVLRRGIIEGCGFLKEHINDDNFIRFSSFVKGTKEKKPVIEISSDDIKNYLDTVEQFLPVREPKVFNDTYRLFLRTLVHEWEESIDPQETTEKYGGDIHTFAWLMKMTRNWVSHANLLEPLTPQIIAFLFLVNMRAMFKLPKEILAYERILLSCISLSPTNSITIEVLERDIKYAEELVDDLLSKMKNISKNESGGFLVTHIINNEEKTKELKLFKDKVNEVYRYNTGQKDAEEHDYKGFLFQYFWINQKSYLGKLTVSLNEFLPTLADHIYTLSFS